MQKKDIPWEVGVCGLICLSQQVFLCWLQPLTATGDAQGGCGVSGSWGWEEPSPADEEPSFPVPRHSSGALGTVCCRAGGEGAVDGPNSSCPELEQELTGLWGGCAEEETEGQERSWAGASGSAVGQGGAEEHTSRCREKAR